MRNKILFFLIICFFFSGNLIYGQCPSGNYTLPDTVCPNTPISITNSSSALSFNWDNGLGDLNSVPTSFILPAVSGTLSYPENMKVVFENGNYYGFVPNALGSYITKYEFGNSLNNNPSISNLPSDVTLSSLQTGIDAVKENGKWYLFVSMFSSNSIVKVEMDSINQNTNLIFTNIPIAGLNNPWSIKLINHVGFIMNNQDDKIIRIDFNGSYTNTPVLIQPNVSTGYFNNFGFDVAYDCTINSYIGFGTSYSGGAIVKFNFGNSLLNTPSVSTILNGVSGAQGVLLIKENGTWHLFLVSNNNSFYNYSLGDNLNNSLNLLYSNTLNATLSDPKNIQLFKDGNNWTGMISSTSSFNIVRINFPFSNQVNNQFSTDQTPTTISFSPNTLGYQRIEFREEFANGVSNVYLDSVFVNIAPPIANFTTSNLCINDSVSFFDSSEICFGNIVNWNWTFGDGETSTDQNPKHLYSTSGVFNVTLSILDNSNQTSTYNQNITIRQKPTTDFTFINNSCSGTQVLFNDASLSNDGLVNNWNWVINNNNFTNSSTSSSFNNPGLYSIKLVTTTEFGCSDSITKQITIEPTPIADFSVNNTCVNEVAAFTNLTDSNTISNVSYQWQIGGFLGTNNTNPIYQFPSIDGIYGIVLIANSPNGCADTIIKSVLIGNRPNPDFTLSSDTICQNSLFTINDNSTPGFFNTIINRQWNMGNGIIINDSLNFEYAYSTPGNYQIQLTVLSPTNCDSSITKTIVVVASPVANYNVTNVCLGSSTQFTDLSTSPSGTFINTWALNYGDNSQTSNPNSTHVYQNDGNYTSTLIVTSNIGCTDTTSITAIVHPLPSANFISGKACTGKEISFTDSTTISSGTINNWTWNFGNGLGTSTLQNPTYIFQNNFAYPVQLISSSSYGCLDTITKFIVVEKTPDFNIVTNDNCDGFFSQLNYSLLSSASTNLAFLWNFGDSTSSFQPSPSHLFGSAGNYNVTLEVTDLTNGCAITKVDTLTINPNPIANFNSSDACIGKELVLDEDCNIASGTIADFTWNINNTQLLNGNSVAFTSSQTGTLNTTLIATSNFGCKDSISKIITIYPNPSVAFTSDLIYGAPPLTVNFENTSSLGNYSWNFGDGSPISSQYNPSHIFFDTGSYQVKLYVVSQFGCIDSAQSTINIFEPIVDIGIINNGINKSGNKWLMKALFKNNGNLTINELDVKLNLQGKSVLYERISSLNLLPGSSIEYEFNSSFDAGDYSPSYFCVEVTAVDNSTDFNSQNNSFCTTLKKDFECYNLYPNPTTDFISFGITIPEDDNITVTLYDENGKSFIESNSNYYKEGYSTVNINLNQPYQLSAGTYFINVQYKDENRTLKFVKH